jgi:competence protein ComEA
MGRRVRLIPGWRRILLLAAPPLLATGGLVSAFVIVPALRQPAAPAPLVAAVAAAAVPPPAPGVLVDVTGAVVHPGLYRVPRGERVFAAIAAAGGLAANADSAHLPNLAGLLKDGQQIKVPAARSSSVASRPPLVDLNTAPFEDLMTVPGFTPELAQAVIEYRTGFGGFQSTRELVDVLSMGEAEYLLARRHVRT